MSGQEEKKLAQWSFAVSVLALIISGWTSWQSRRQINADYDAAVVVSPGVLPVPKLPSGEQKIDFEVSNTAKDNVHYFVRAETNMGCLKGSVSQPRLVPCGYESQIISLSKPEAGSHKFTHEILLKAAPGSVEMSPLSLASDPKYYLSIEVVDASNGKALFQSLCYYTYLPDANLFNLYLPVIDTTGQSTILQAKCQG